MKALFIVVLSLVSIFSFNPARALDTEVTVLVLRTPGTTLSVVQQNIQRLLEIWPNPSGINLVIANGGQPKFWSQVIPETGNLEGMLASASGLQSWANMRDNEHYADIILLFVPGSSSGAQTCGNAPQQYWAADIPLSTAR